MRGGYKILDLNNVNITLGGAGVEIKGIYEHIEGNYRKPTIVSGLVIDNKEYNDMFVNFTPNGNVFIGYLRLPNEIQIEIQDDDTVTITQTV